MPFTSYIYVSAFKQVNPNIPRIFKQILIAAIYVKRPNVDHQPSIEKLRQSLFHTFTKVSLLLMRHLFFQFKFNFSHWDAH